MAGRRRAQPRGERAVELTDPAAVRALAHPARLLVIDALFSGDVLTATELAELAGTTPSAMSYHLRALERHGIVERAEPRGDARQRPWRRAGTELRVNLRGTGSTAGSAAATEVLLAETMAMDRRRLVAQISGGDPAWSGAVTYDRSRLLVTPDEARRLIAAVAELVAPYQADRRPTASADAERVTVVLTMVRESSPPA